MLEILITAALLIINVRVHTVCGTWVTEAFRAFTFTLLSARRGLACERGGKDDVAEKKACLVLVMKCLQSYRQRITVYSRECDEIKTGSFATEGA